MIQRKKWLFIGIALIAFALLKVSMLLLWQAKQPKAQAQSCQITQTPCPFADGATLQLLGVGNNQTPFSIRATHIPANVNDITVSFTMRDMDMGFNRFALQKQADGSWLAEGVRLPMCTQSRHDWQIHWQMNGQHFQADFQTKP